VYTEELLELVKQHDLLAREKNVCYYWETPEGQRLTNVNLARWYEKEFHCWVKFVCSPEYMQKFKDILKDKTIDMDFNYNLDFIKKLKRDYDHVALLYSGGFDSQRIFLDHIENGLRVDETITHVNSMTEDAYNQDIRFNAVDNITKYAEHIDKVTTLQNTEQDLANQWADPWSFFTRHNGCIMPERAGHLGLEYFYNFNSPFQTWGDNELHSLQEVRKNGCVITGKDKPQLVYYKQRWYCVMIDSLIGDRSGLQNTIFFWYHPDNIKGMLKEARLYREFILDYKYGMNVDNEGKLNLQDPDQNPLGTLAFFKFFENNQHNHIIGRPDLLALDKKFSKTQEYLHHKYTMAEADRWDIIIPYAKSMERFLEIFPECTKGFTEYNNQGKFSWFIDIDSLEIYTQQELIPDGFEDITHIKNDAMEKLKQNKQAEVKDITLNKDVPRGWSDKFGKVLPFLKNKLAGITDEQPDFDVVSVDERKVDCRPVPLGAKLVLKP